MAHRLAFVASVQLVGRGRLAAGELVQRRIREHCHHFVRVLRCQWPERRPRGQSVPSSRASSSLVGHAPACRNTRTVTSHVTVRMTASAIQGAELEAYEVDGWHKKDGIVLEVEAGRGAMGNAIYRSSGRR